MLVVLEGCNGVGKTTMCKLLGGRFKSLGYPVTHVREPGTTAEGEAIRPLVRERSATPLSKALMCLAARAECIETVIKPALARNNIVIADRFAPSTIVYQYRLGGVNSEMLGPVDEYLGNQIDKSITFVLDASVETIQQRIEDDSENVYRGKGNDYLESCRQQYLSLANEKNYIVINANENLCQQSSKMMAQILPAMGLELDTKKLSSWCS